MLSDDEKVEALAAPPRDRAALRPVRAVGRRAGRRRRGSVRARRAHRAEQGVRDAGSASASSSSSTGGRRSEILDRAARAARPHARGGARHGLSRARRDREGSMDPYLRDVLDVLLRMLHVIAGIAWIGASFYFVRLDLALRAPKRQEDADAGVAGEFWGVHGGGLYHSQKYRLAPAEMPEPLHWFKWEAYTTWLSGFALFVVLYYFDAGVRLVDPAVADLDDWQAIALSVVGIALAWIVYDVLCRTVGQRSQAALAVLGTALVALAAWGVERALRASSRVPPGRRDARDDHGRERPPRDHPRAPEARRRDGGEARARRRAAARGEEPVGPQQLPHAARAVHDARRPLRLRVRRRRGLARLRRHRGAHRAHPRLLQPLARRPTCVVDPGSHRARPSSGSRSGCDPRSRRRRPPAT